MSVRAATEEIRPLGSDAEELADPYPRSQSRRVWDSFVEQRTTLIAFAVLVGFVGIAVFAPLVATHDPIKQNLAEMMRRPFTPGYLLGTDELGRDIFSRLVFGARISVAVAILVVLTSLCVGTTLGIVAGYFKGALDNLLMRVVDLVMTFPCLVLGICIVSVFGPGLFNAAVAVAIYNIPVFARTARIETLTVATHEYVEVARAQGLSRSRIIFTHILPNVVSPLIVLATLSIGNAIVIIASLGFLGLGAQPPTPEWGAVLSNGRQFLMMAPHIIVIPGLALFLLVVSLNLLGDALRDALDPTLQR